MDLDEKPAMDLDKKSDQLRFQFNERKAAAAAAMFLQLAGGEMEYVRLLKLLYFADRESLDRLGRPISGDQYVSMEHGPVLSRVYNLMKGVVFGHPESGPWAEQIRASGRYTLKTGGQPDLGALCQAEVDVIAEVFRRYGHLHMWRLRDDTHRLEEWEDPGESSKEIQVETILRVLGKGEAEIDEIRQAAREDAHFDSIFGR